MPIPKPSGNESRDSYMKRCMADNTMVSEYQRDQRVAICSSTFEGSKGEIRKDVFTTEYEAEERAEEIGCNGYHRHQEDGKDVFMPCKTHTEYVRLRGEDVKMEAEELFMEDAEVESLQCPVEFKAHHEDDKEDEGVFSGYASMFDNTDLGGDVVERGAFSKSLRRKGARKIKLLYQHDAKEPIGVLDSVKEDKDGLYVKGRLAMGTQKGKEVFELMKMGAIDGMSIGYRVDQKGQSYDERRKKRYLKEVDLMEVSMVTFPMNPKARIYSVKAQDRTVREWEQVLRDAGCSRSEAKVAASAVSKSFDQREVVKDKVANIGLELNKLAKMMKG